jgi:SAM-dependent methyltransferase
VIGQATARLEPLSRRWLVRLWGQPSIHTRQHWTAVWPYLAQLPAGPLHVLDAGCGAGAWSLELALRRRAWAITGVDRSEPSLEAAETARRQLAVENAVFVRSDFLDFRPTEQFDVVLSVASAHYLLQNGRGEELFQKFGSWLRPGGLLLLFAPRCRREVPWLRLLPPPFELRDVVSADQVRSLCRVGGLEVRTIAPAIGVLGTLAKQISHAVAQSWFLRLATYPAQLVLTVLDPLVVAGHPSGRSSGVVLVAERRGGTLEAAKRGGEEAPGAL